MEKTQSTIAVRPLDVLVFFSKLLIFEQEFSDESLQARVLVFQFHDSKIAGMGVGRRSMGIRMATGE